MAIFWYIGTYNSLVRLDESVQTAWSDVEVQYERRADLIPNLVATVQGAADFEQSTQTEITELRSAAIAAKQDLLAAQSPEEGIQAAQEIDAIAQRVTSIIVSVENYPQLRATENFARLQDELAGTENRVAVARTRYNEVVRSYNTRIRTFPSSLIASMQGFERHELFEASEGSQEAPRVTFT